MTENRWVRLVSALTRATQESAIRWEVLSRPASLPSDHERVEAVYETTYLDQRFRLYRYEMKYYLDEDRYNWGTAFQLSFVDDNGMVRFEVPNDIPGLPELYQAVRYQDAGVDEFFRRLAG